MRIARLCKNGISLTIKAFVFLEDHQTLFKAYFIQKQTKKKTFQFLTKIVG